MVIDALFDGLFFHEFQLPAELFHSPLPVPPEFLSAVSSAASFAVSSFSLILFLYLSFFSSISFSLILVPFRIWLVFSAAHSETASSLIISIKISSGNPKIFFRHCQSKRWHAISSTIPLPITTFQIYTRKNPARQLYNRRFQRIILL